MKNNKLTLQNERLREALFRAVLCHDHECSEWRIGKSYRACTCEASKRALTQVKAVALGE